MRKIREVLRLQLEAGLSVRQIAKSLLMELFNQDGPLRFFGGGGPVTCTRSKELDRARKTCRLQRPDSQNHEDSEE